jgi:single-strand selective monofunctional uracil DNA glycosylase
LQEEHTPLNLIDSALQLKRELERFPPAPPVTHIYRPLDYAWDPHRMYLERYGTPPREVLLVGMNPGPWGMVQTGVPFGDVEWVRDWLHIEGSVGRPPTEHPKRPVDGFACRRREGSGRRLWGWAKDRFGAPEAFFARFFVGNYCPLCFFLEDGTNLTPDKLPEDQRRHLQAACDRALARMVEILRPRYVLGVGRYAERRVAQILAGSTVIPGGVPHPSPASPRANRGWSAQMECALRAIGIQIP